MQARKTVVVPSSPSVIAEEAEAEEEEPAPGPSEQEEVDVQADQAESYEPAEMTALRLELSTLGTSHASLQNTLQLLQAELVDLKRVNHELQDENESYNILLR